MRRLCWHGVRPFVSVSVRDACHTFTDPGNIQTVDRYVQELARLRIDKHDAIMRILRDIAPLRLCSEHKHLRDDVLKDLVERIAIMLNARRITTVNSWPEEFHALAVDERNKHELLDLIHAIITPNIDTALLLAWEVEEAGLEIDYDEFESEVDIAMQDRSSDEDHSGQHHSSPEEEEEEDDSSGDNSDDEEEDDMEIDLPVTVVGYRKELAAWKAKFEEEVENNRLSIQAKFEHEFDDVSDDHFIYLFENQFHRLEFEEPWHGRISTEGWKDADMVQIRAMMHERAHNVRQTMLAEYGLLPPGEWYTSSDVKDAIEYFGDPNIIIRAVGDLPLRDLLPPPGPCERDHVARKPLTDMCGICWSPDLIPENDITWCKAECGTNFHASCFQTWHLSDRGGAEEPLGCPMCRTTWLYDSNCDHDTIFRRA